MKSTFTLLRSIGNAVQTMSRRSTHVRKLSTSLICNGKRQSSYTRHYSMGSHSASDVEKFNVLAPQEKTDETSPTLTNQQEEEWMELGDLKDDLEDVYDEFKGISLERGSTGVFDVEELVELLRRENLNDIATITIPPELTFVDYMVIATGRSPKQMLAVAEFIRKVFKRRALSSDPLPVIEGKDNKDWIAIDLGNIALHIFSRRTRQTYDLETLWTCGAKYDDLSQETEDPFASFKLQFPSTAKTQ